MTNRSCPSCGKSTLFRAESVNVRVGYTLDLLPGLGDFMGKGKVDVVVCRDCGLTQFFTRPEFLEKLESSSDWKRV